jgi:hypothetical protein
MANRDYYQLLGVPRKATQREIRRAYRVLVRKCHPDFNPGDKTAAQQFREIQEAYEVLGNSRKRKAYDYYGPAFGQRTPAGNVDSTRPQSAPRGNVPHDFGSYTSGHAGASDPHPRSGRFPGRVTYRAWLGTLTLVAVFLIGWFIFFFLPDSGVREFKRAQEALRHVTSWKMEGHNASPGADLDFVQEVACPSSERLIQHIRATGAGQSTELTVETITIGNDRYSYNDRARKWTHDRIGAGEPSTTCAELSRGEDVGQLLPFGNWLGGSYFIEKENLRETSDGKCREWKVLAPGGFSGRPTADFVCLGVNDHLPRFHGAPGIPEEIRYYDWNVPIDIRRPLLEPSPGGMPQ